MAPRNTSEDRIDFLMAIIRNTDARPNIANVAAEIGIRVPAASMRWLTIRREIEARATATAAGGGGPVTAPLRKQRKPRKAPTKKAGTPIPTSSEKGENSGDSEEGDSEDGGEVSDRSEEEVKVVVKKETGGGAPLRAALPKQRKPRKAPTKKAGTPMPTSSNLKRKLSGVSWEGNGQDGGEGSDGSEDMQVVVKKAKVTKKAKAKVIKAVKEEASDSDSDSDPVQVFKKTKTTKARKEEKEKEEEEEEEEEKEEEFEDAVIIQVKEEEKGYAGFYEDN